MDDFYERLIEIADVFDTYDYDWVEWRAYYDPVTRMYFVGDDAGCSCHDYEIENAFNEADAMHSKQDVLRHLKSWASMYANDESMRRQYENARRLIHLWKPPKGEQA